MHQCKKLSLYVTSVFQYFRDLLPAAKSLRMLDNVIKQLDYLPPVYRDFYSRRLVGRIQDKCYL